MRTSKCRKTQSNRANKPPEVPVTPEVDDDDGDDVIYYDNAAEDGLFEARVDFAIHTPQWVRGGEKLFHRVEIQMSARAEGGPRVGLMRTYDVCGALEVRDLRRLAAQVDLPLNGECDIHTLVDRLRYKVFVVRLSTDADGERILDFIDKAPSQRDIPDARNADNIWDNVWHHDLRREEANRRYREGRSK